MTVIAMTREMGTLGKDVAQGIADALGMKVIHSELVEHDLAGKLGMQESAVHRYLDGSASLLERWKVDKAKLSRCTAEEMLEIARQGNAVIRGWGAVSVLRQIPHVLRVRVCAPMAFRQRVMVERLGDSHAGAARGEIEQNDAAHAGITRKFFKVNWEDPLLYHVVLNTGSVPVDTCVKTVRLLAEDPAFQETEATRAILADKLLEHRVRSIVSEKNGDATIIDISVTGGRVILSGAVIRDYHASDIVNVVRAVPGVKAVENNIIEAGGYHVRM